MKKGISFGWLAGFGLFYQWVAGRRERRRKVGRKTSSSVLSPGSGGSGFTLALAGMALFGAILGSAADTIFHDGFESGSLGPAWSIETSYQGRATVSTNFGPAEGAWQLILDDSVNDAIYSLVQATLHLDLTARNNVVLSFKVKSLGNEPDWPYASTSNFDGVTISPDGGHTWRLLTSLDSVSTDWQEFSFQLDWFLPSWGQPFGSDVLIRFSEYDNASAPLDGIAIDDVTVTGDEEQRAVLELPATVLEGSGPHTGYVLLSFPPTNTLTLALTASPSNQLVLPATVDVPAGKTYASFEFSVVDDSLVNLARNVVLSVGGLGIWGSGSSVTVLDDEPLNATLSLPSQLTEGEFPSTNASITLDRAPTVDMVWSLWASSWEELTFPYNVVIPAGQTQVVFTVTATDDTRLDGNIQVTLNAVSFDKPPITAQTTTGDNDAPSLWLRLPSTITEGSTTNGAVVISGTLTTNLEVQLSCTNPAALSVPATVTIWAGQTEAGFDLTAVDNSLRDGTRLAEVRAVATGFPSTNQLVVIRDNEVANYVFSGLADIMQIDRSVGITLQAADVEGNVIDRPAGPVYLSLVLPDGTLLPVTPPAVSLSSPTGWAGNITLPPAYATPLRLRAADAQGNTSDSPPFDLMRMVDLKSGGLVWDAFRSRVYATVPANSGDTNANQLVAIDPVNARVMASVQLAQDPGQVVLTSGGEWLYVALNANGTIARIDPSTLTVQSIFEVGTSTTDGTLFATDMCPIAGTPDGLVVSRNSRSSSYYSIARYDNGVPRPGLVQNFGTPQIEPSADPDFLFSFNASSSPTRFEKLRLYADGVTNADINPVLLDSYSSEVRADGNLVVTASGVELDGAQMQRLGVFPVRGPVCPSLAAHRVYFLENVSPYWWETTYGRIGAYDSTTLLCLRRLTLSTILPSAQNLLRWGTNGLACRTDSNVVFVTSSRLVPTSPVANLAISLRTAPNPATAGQPLTYSVSVTNQGPAAAENVAVSVRLSDYQTIQQISVPQGSFDVTNSIDTLPSVPPYYQSITITNWVVTAQVPNLAAGAVTTLTITTVPSSAGALTCTGSTASDAVDPDYSDNAASQSVSVGFQSKADSINQLRLGGNNLLFDPTRNLLWATVAPLYSATPASAIVSIDPNTGLTSTPILISSNLVPKCFAISANGRYLYVGLREVAEVWRLDLAATPPAILHIPLKLNSWESISYTEDIEPLDGDGTSFLVALASDSSAAVFDGATRRPDRSGIYTVDRLARTALPGVFVGYCNYISSYPLSLLEVTAPGVAVRQTENGFIGGGLDIQGNGGMVLGGSGYLINSTNFTLKADFRVRGTPCLDEPNHRAYLVKGSQILGFDTDTLLPAGALSLPVAQGDDWAQSCIRWGLDGLGILGTDGTLHVVRWSALPAYTDSNSDGLPDAWELAYFGTLQVDPAADPDGDGIRNCFEYLFGSSPVEPSPSPFQASLVITNGQPTLRMVFPRRAGLSPRPYEYQSSPDLARWTATPDVSETVVATRIIDGIAIQNVEAFLPITNAPAGFVRLNWLR